MDNIPDILPQDNSPKTCIGCKTAPAMEGYPNPLCHECREKYIKYPVPKWIYAFAGGILLVMLFSMTRVPVYYRLASDYGKAKKAIEARNFMTAEKYLKKVLETVPGYEEAKAYRLIAACYNLQTELAKSLYSDLQYKKLDIDGSVRIKTEQAIEFLGDLYEFDTTFPKKLSVALKDSAAGLMNLYAQIDTTHEEYLAVSELLIADKLYEMDRIVDCDTILTRLYRRRPDFYGGYGLLSAVNRRLGNFDEAIANCNMLLQVNNEDVGTIALKARIELARKNLKKAAEYISVAEAIDPRNHYLLEARTLLAYFKGDMPKSRQLLAELNKLEPDSEKLVYKRVLAIVDGITTFK